MVFKLNYNQVVKSCTSIALVDINLVLTCFSFDASNFKT